MIQRHNAYLPSSSGIIKPLVLGSGVLPAQKYAAIDQIWVRAQINFDI